MGQPIAKEGDRVVGIDTHIVLVPSGSGTVPTPTPVPFSGPLSQDLASTVFVDNLTGAVKGSVALNQPGHVAANGPFQKQPSDRGTVSTASRSVFLDGKEVARSGDRVETCNDPSDAPKGTIVAQGTVFAG
jgi:uncharacterized Zn-binding protein involved in type VI secretion